MNNEFLDLWHKAEGNHEAARILLNRLIPIQERLKLAEKELNKTNPQGD